MGFACRLFNGAAGSLSAKSNVVVLTSHFGKIEEFFSIDLSIALSIRNEISHSGEL
jgi:hypothetical protein